MADDVAATLFTEARARHEAARRWFFIAAAALAFFHLMIFRPYVDLTGKKTEAASALVHETALKQELDGMGSELGRLNALSTEEAKRRLDGLLADLRRTFGRLNGIFAELRSMGADRAGGEPGERLFPSAESSTMAIQMPAPVANAAGTPMPVEIRLPAMNGLLRHGIADATSQGAVLDLIKPYIDLEIIAPKFSRFNESWREDVAPEVAIAGDALLQRIRTAGSRFPGEAASWTSVAQAVSGVVSATGQFKIEPPSAPFWWAAVEGKDAAVQGFLRTLGDSALDRATSFAELRLRTEAAIAANNQRQEKIDGLIARLNEEFREQQKELAALVEPLRGISIDLATIVPYFSVILGVSFVALTVWLASRIQELGEAVALVARGEPASLASEWLRGRVAASLWHRRAPLLARCVVLVAWVALASWELAGASLAGRAEALLFGLAGAIGIALASRYEWRVVQSLGDPAASS
jgi:hypothetical protein